MTKQDDSDPLPEAEPFMILNAPSDTRAIIKRGDLWARRSNRSVARRQGFAPGERLRTSLWLTAAALAIAMALLSVYYLSQRLQKQSSQHEVRRPSQP